MNEYGNSFEFIVSFCADGTSQYCDMSFQKISNLQSKIEYEVIHEGGNPVPVLLPIPSKQPETVTLEKGMLLGTEKSFWDSLRPGMMVKDVVIYVRQYQATVRKLGFDQGIVLSKEYPQLNAMSGEIYIEKMQIAHSGLREEFVAYGV